MGKSIAPELLANLTSLAENQGGFVLASQLARMSLCRSTICSLTRPGGPLRRVLPATYLVGGGELTSRAREQAVLLYAGAPSRLTGNAALRAYGLRYAPKASETEPVHVLIEHERTRASRGFARVERTLRFPPAVEHGGRSLAPMPRALFDAARHQSDLRTTRAVTLEALQSGRTQVARLEREITKGQRRWTAGIRQVVAEYKAGVVSAPEAEFRSAWEAQDRPSLYWNPTLLSLEGHFIAEVDAYDEEVGLAIECDSVAFHSGPRYPQTVARHRRLATYGIVVCSIVPSQFRADPAAVISEVLLSRASLLGRPRLLIKVVPFSGN